MLVTISLGLLLGVGFNLKWDGRVAKCRLLEPVNTAIWQPGHLLKPQVFVSRYPPPPFDTAIPMPGLMLAAIVPYWEGARTLSRYILVAGIGFFILASNGIERFRFSIPRIVAASLLIIEIVPPPAEGLPFPIPSHPAFEWLAQQSAFTESIVELHAPEPGTLTLPIEGKVLWATRYHGKATVAGTTSVVPAHTLFLFNWLLEHSHPFQHPDFVPLLRYYQADLILLHMNMENREQILKEARSNGEVKLVECFTPSPDPSPWPYPICILEILPSSNPHLNLLLRNGWSGEEPWGTWASEADSHAQWVATSRIDHVLFLETSSHCVPGRNQSLSLEVNGEELATHQWEDCEPWSGEVLVPAALVQIGWNDVSLHYTCTVKPADLADGENPDPRLLSIGFTRLEVEKR